MLSGRTRQRSLVLAAVGSPSRTVVERRAVDVVVLGAGPLAAATAYSLARRGKKVVLIPDFGIRARIPPTEGLRPLHLPSTTPLLTHLTKDAASYWRGLQMQLTAATPLLALCPTLDLAAAPLATRGASSGSAGISGREAAARRDRITEALELLQGSCKEAGLKLGALTGQELGAVVPLLRGVAGHTLTGLLQPDGGVISPGVAVRALTAMAARNGVMVRDRLVLKGWRDNGDHFVISAAAPSPLPLTTTTIAAAAAPASRAFTTQSLPSTPQPAPFTSISGLQTSSSPSLSSFSSFSTTSTTSSSSTPAAWSPVLPDGDPSAVSVFEAEQLLLAPDESRWPLESLQLFGLDLAACIQVQERVSSSCGASQDLSRLPLVRYWGGDEGGSGEEHAAGTSVAGGEATLAPFSAGGGAGSGVRTGTGPPALSSGGAAGGAVTSASGQLPAGSTSVPVSPGAATPPPHAWRYMLYPRAFSTAAVKLSTPPAAASSQVPIGAFDWQPDANRRDVDRHHRHASKLVRGLDEMEEASDDSGRSRPGNGSSGTWRISSTGSSTGSSTSTWSSSSTWSGVSSSSSVSGGVSSSRGTGIRQPGEVSGGRGEGSGHGVSSLTPAAIGLCLASPDGMPLVGFHPGFQEGRVVVACSVSSVCPARTTGHAAPGPTPEAETGVRAGASGTNMRGSGITSTVVRDVGAGAAGSPSAIGIGAGSYAVGNNSGGGSASSSGGGTSSDGSGTVAPSLIGDGFQLTPLLAKAAADLLLGVSEPQDLAPGLVSLQRPSLSSMSVEPRPVKGVDSWDELHRLQDGSALRTTTLEEQQRAEHEAEERRKALELRDGGGRRRSRPQQPKLPQLDKLLGRS